jgi:uncharacterized protein (TIGR01244 family)
MRAVLDTAPGPVLAFCRSGARSTMLWALAEARAGRPIAELLETGAELGQDLRGLVAIMRELGGS